MTSETPIENMPEWFDPARHAVTPAGIVRSSDQALLGDDGLPASGALRAAEARAIERAAPAEVPEAEQAKTAKTKNQKTEAENVDR